MAGDRPAIVVELAAKSAPADVVVAGLQGKYLRSGTGPVIFEMEIPSGSANLSKSTCPDQSGSSSPFDMDP